MNPLIIPTLKDTLAGQLTLPVPDWKQKLSPYQRYLRSKHWLNLRAEKLEAAGHCCNRCGSVQDLEVHHVYYAKSWWKCQLADLEVLCEDCHAKTHHIRKPDSKPKRAKARNVLALRRVSPGYVCARY